ncbi:hypothetical protein AGMMS49975_10900 [Clostridia bacterium]|nr:hypothetical protein AGMMS49975_10900 [Clostridia bacterium]
MAIFHLNLKIVTRGTGTSAVAKAAYHSGDKLTNEYDGHTFDYDQKIRVVHKEICCPTMRPFNEDGSWDAKFTKVYELDESGNKIYDPKTHCYKSRAMATTDWNDCDKAEVWRVAWADATNAALAAHGFPETINHRSFERQGKEEKPTFHLGVAVMQLERCGIKTNHGDINREVEAYNKELRRINARIRKSEVFLCFSNFNHV